MDVGFPKDGQALSQVPDLTYTETPPQGIPNLRRWLVLLFISVYVVGHLAVSPDGIIATADSGVLPRFLAIAPEILSVLILLFSPRSKLDFSLGYSRWFTGLTLWVGLLLLSGVVGMMSNTVPALAVVSGWRSYLRFLPPFLIGMLLLEAEDVVWLLKALLVVGLLQVPIALVQTVYGGNPDYVSGLMGAFGSGKLAIFQTMCVGILLSDYLNRRFRLTAFVYRVIPLGIILLSVVILAEVKAFFLFLIIMGVSVVRSRIFSRSGMMVVSLVVAGLFGSAWLYSEYFRDTGTVFQDNILEIYSSPSALQDLILGDQTSSATGVTSAGRLQVFLEEIVLLRESGDELIGYGPGVLSTSSLLDPLSGSAIFYRYYDYFLGSTSGGSTILLEMGLVGVLWWVLFILSIFLAWVKVQRSAPSIPQLAYFQDSFIAFFALMLISLFYNDALFSPGLLYPFMLLAGYVVKFAMNPRSRERWEAMQ